MGLLHPPHVELDVRAPGLQRVESAELAPGEGGAQVEVGVAAGLAAVSGVVGRDRETGGGAPGAVTEGDG